MPEKSQHCIKRDVRRVQWHRVVSWLAARAAAVRCQPAVQRAEGGQGLWLLYEHEIVSTTIDEVMAILDMRT